ncbi:hypothetical protein [Humidesulfovibrio mexicanus]|jgi:hypothetical protein|nr:hypothetical protein [Humidesulfovibrio mexicanus]
MTPSAKILGHTKSDALRLARENVRPGARVLASGGAFALSTPNMAA